MEEIKDHIYSVEIPLEVGSISLSQGFDPRGLVQVSIARSLMRIAEALEALYEKV